ncbi:hypothetical protein IC582_015956 [Cucumis melo]|uniref:Pentatricopeptide repeat-containing protein n=1 Tax=Cucumis melo var. makuwa TaxID=1194695 RepID=A0A5A7UA48_CUCMM|nr:pentatricopeptide repeat-containing protein [Cucumis melo var. makuwa]TYK01797.1 pentatricopeptide repeat-containing protein [Cucumis melo var. makuwa]
MAGLSISKNMATVLFKSQSLNSYPRLPTLRCYSSRLTETVTKSSTKTEKARAMARMINSKPWSSDLESSLASLSPSLSKTTVLQTLGFLRDPPKALQFFNWAQEMGYTHTEQSYFSMLEILGRNRHLNTARNFLFSIEKRSRGIVKLEARFFNSLMRNFSRAGLFQESIKVFTIMKSHGVSPSVVTFNSLLTILLKRGRTNMAKNVYYEMLSTYGVTPDTYTFNILIRGFCMNGMVDDGFRIFNDLPRFGCEPDVVTYNTLVDGLCRAGKVTVAYNLAKGMGKKSVDLNPNVVTYTTLIRGYCAKREIDKALAVFEEMVNQGLKANNITYNTLIKGLCEAQKFEKIKEILEATAGDGTFSPDTCTFNTLMHCHCHAGNLDDALKVFERMSELKIQPDSATYSVLARSLCQGGHYEKAEDLLDKLLERKILLSDDSCKPLVASYNPIFKYLCENGKTKKAEKVFRQLMRRGTQDPPSYKTLIMGHCKEGTFESGYELLVLMLRKDFLPDFEIYESLINGLLHIDKPLLALQSLEKMLKSSHRPKSSTFHSILAKLLEQGSASESASLIQLMLDKNIRQNLSFSTGCVRLLFGAGMNDKAFLLVHLLYKKGYSVKMEELIHYLCHCRKVIQASKLLLFSLESHQFVDMDVCNTVIFQLCEISKLSEAFSLYYKLVEMGVHQQLSCQNQLKVSLEAGEKLEEAEFVSKRMEPVEMGVHQQLSCQNKLKVSHEAGGKLEEAEFVQKRMERRLKSKNSNPRV